MEQTSGTLPTHVPLVHPLDGDATEFPHRAEAMLLYRTYWEAWLVTSNPEHKHLLEVEMDAEQLRISRGPGPLWRAYRATLPGYMEVWGKFSASTREAIDALRVRE